MCNFNDGYAFWGCIIVDCSASALQGCCLGLLALGDDDDADGGDPIVIPLQSPTVDVRFRSISGCYSTLDEYLKRGRVWKGEVAILTSVVAGCHVLLERRRYRLRCATLSWWGRGRRSASKPQPVSPQHQLHHRELQSWKCG